MAKSLKKALIAVGALLVVITGLMVCIPFLFKDTIKTTVVKIVNQQVNAKVDIGDFGLSLFKNFPNVTLSLYDVTVAGISDFEKDTLLQAKAVSLAINLYSLFEGNYEVSGINLDHVSLSAKVLTNGKANWDIVKESAPATDEVKSDTFFHISLKKITVKDCNVTCQDDASKMKAVLTKWNGDLSGDFSASQTILRTGSTMKGKSYPAFDMKISVSNAMFQYPSLPKPVDNFNLHIALQSKGGSLNNTVVDISKFNFTIAKETATAIAKEAIGKLTGSEEAVDLSEEKAKQIEKLRQEADNAAKKLVAKAGNGLIAKTAAQAAGKKLVEEERKNK
jgi:uncharacterized protein involved in outer membrane biogenesis